MIITIIFNQLLTSCLANNCKDNRRTLDRQQQGKQLTHFSDQLDECGIFKATKRSIKRNFLKSILKKQKRKRKSKRNIGRKPIKQHHTSVSECNAHTHRHSHSDVMIDYNDLIIWCPLQGPTQLSLLASSRSAIGCPGLRHQL